MLRVKIENGRRGICRNVQTYTMITVEHTAKAGFCVCFT